MSNFWPKFTKENPCPACAHWDWLCRYGDRQFICMRVSSSHPSNCGGYFHPLNNAPLPPPKPKFKVPEIPKLDARKIISEWSANTSELDLGELAESLGVSVESVAALGAAKAFWRKGLWSLEKFPARAWAFPMRDGHGNIIGIRMRANGQKWAVTGSRNGIFIPQMYPMRYKVAYLPEGPTSTAAALTMGLFAIGRPACHIGGPDIKVVLKRLGISRVVIVADSDDKPTGLRPGYDGAVKLAKEIGVRSIIWTPPTKDIRDFYRAGGTKEVIESELKNFVWKIYQ